MKKIDINSLAPDELKQIEQQLTVTLKEIVERAVFEANKHLNQYGIEAVMAIELIPAEQIAGPKPDNLKDTGLESGEG